MVCTSISKTIAENTKLPLILYNVLQNVVSLASDTVIKLSQIDNIIGVKEASGNLEEIAGLFQEPEKAFCLEVK